MTREEAIKKHRELWHWIAEEHRRRKSEIVHKEDNPDVAKERPLNSCWLCEYVLSIGNHCKDCPINWGGKICVRARSPYMEWVFGSHLDYEERAKLADTIAELPEKERT